MARSARSSRRMCRARAAAGRAVALALALALGAACGAGGSDGPAGPGQAGATTTARPPTTAPPEPGEGAGGPTERAIARALFERVNAERQARGLKPLQWNHALTRLARDWSEHLADIGRLEHRDINQLLGSEGLEQFVALGENIFRATGPVPAGRIHVGWMQSSGHRANILQPGFNRIGIGIVCTPGGEVYATQEFGRTENADRPPLSEDTPPEQPIARPAETGPSCPM